MSSVAASRHARTRGAGWRTSHLVDASRERVLDAAAVALAGLFVLSVGLTDGGYYGSAYTELTTLLAAAVLLALIAGLRPQLSRARVVALASMALLTMWVALSSLWAHPGAAVDLEIRRSVLYTAALAASVVIVGAGRERAFLVGLLAAISLVGAIAVGVRGTAGAPVDRLYGTLLEEPIGYPNALGVLVAIGAVLAIGLASDFGGSRSRVVGAVAPFLVFVLGLTGSRGGALALGLGLAALAILAPPRSRRPISVMTACALAIGGTSWALVQWHELGGAVLLALATATLGAGWLIGSCRLPFGSRALLLGAAGVLAGALVLVAIRPPAVSTSYRSDYWRAAIAEAADHPLFGTGAGSFYLTWRERRDVDLTVRDAHSLYVETLSELGAVGLGLVLVLVTTPLAVAVRRRCDPLAATAGAGFVVFAAHAAVDWDWEMPVVTLAGLGCAGVLVASKGDRADARDRSIGRDTRCS